MRELEAKKFFQATILYIGMTETLCVQVNLIMVKSIWESDMITTAVDIASPNHNSLMNFSFGTVLVISNEACNILYK